MSNLTIFDQIDTCKKFYLEVNLIKTVKALGILALVKNKVLRNDQILKYFYLGQI